MTCRICLEEGNTTSVCDCKGTQGQVHIKCVKKWIEISGKTECELCQTEYHPKVTATPNVGIYTLGIINALVHAHIILSLIEYWGPTQATEKTLFYSFLFNIIQILLWFPLYDNKRDSITYVVAWLIIYYCASTLLKLSYQIDYVHLICDYSLTLFLSTCCCIQSIRKNSEPFVPVLPEV